MALRDLQAFLEDDGLDYPVREPSFSTDADGQPKLPAAKACTSSECDVTGRHVHYKVPSPDARTGLWLTSLADLSVAALKGASMSDQDRSRLKLDDDEERTLYQRVLGGAYDEMIADNVKWTALQKIGQDAYLCFSMSERVADAALAGQGERQARQNRATRRAVKKTAGVKSRQASGRKVTRTQPPASPASSTSPTGPGEAKAG